MADYNFIEYTPETAEAIKKARSLPPSGSPLPPYPDIQKQQMLNPPQQLIEGSGSEITGPFDVKIEEENVVVYDSTADPDYAYAGYITFGSNRTLIPKTNVSIQFGTLYLDAVYTQNRGYTFTFKIGSFPSQTEDNQYVLRIADITYNEKYILTRKRLPDDIEIFGRWV